VLNIDPSLAKKGEERNKNNNRRLSLD